MDDVAFPALLRAARHAYGHAVRAALQEAGCEDMPRNGPFVLGALARGASPMSEVVGALGVSKQAAGSLVDVMVARSYLTREIDPVDRRRLNIGLTDRGRAAAAVVRDAVENVDARLLAAVGPDAVQHARVVLSALAGDV